MKMMKTVSGQPFSAAISRLLTGYPAENYYAADYPEEDLDWDDEFNRNPYSYTNLNDSDREEFDELDYEDNGFEKADQAGVPQVPQVPKVQAKEWTF
jgi:hypothetical protein